MSKNLFGLNSVKKNYRVGLVDVAALRGIDWQVQEGEFIALRGPSGCGKSTLLNTLGLLETITSGSIEFDGKDCTRASSWALTEQRREAIGFVFQNFNLVPVLSALENVEYPLFLSGRYSRQQIRERATETLKSVGLGDFLHHRPAQLSGGQRQRVAISRALVKRPKVLLADEPTANLDSSSAAQILGLMKELQRREGTTFIVATHDAAVSAAAEKTVLMKDGIIVDKGQSNVAA